MKSRFLLVSLVLLSCHSISIFAQSSVDKAFSDLEKEFGGCQVELQSKNALMGKATSELSRLDSLVTDLKAQAVQSERQNKQLSDQLADANSKITRLTAQATDAQACTEKEAKTAKSLSVTAGAFLVMKGELESTKKKNDELIALNQELKQQLANRQPIIAKTASSSDSSAANDAKLLALEQNKNQQLSQQVNLLQQQAKAQQNQSCPPVSSAQTSGIQCTVLDNANLVKLKLQNSGASSTHNRRSLAKHAIDGKVSSIWASAIDKLMGQSLRVNLNKPSTVSRMHILVPQNGNNVPPESITLYFSNGSSQLVSLPNKFGWHRVAIQPTRTESVDIEFTRLHSVKDIEAKHVIVAEVDLFGE